MTKRFFPLCSRQLIKWRCLTALYSLPLWPFLSGTPGVHCSDDNVAMSTSCRYINQAFESRKFEYLTRIERPLLMCAREHTLAIRIIVHRLIRNKLIWSANTIIPFSFYRINLRGSSRQLFAIIARFTREFETKFLPKFLKDRYRANIQTSLPLSDPVDPRVVYGERKNSPELLKRFSPVFPFPRISWKRCALEIFLRRFSHRRNTSSRENKRLKFHEISHISGWNCAHAHEHIRINMSW